jgi:hypothetical protein
MADREPSQSNASEREIPQSQDAQSIPPPASSAIPQAPLAANLQPATDPDPDPDWDAYLAWREREIAAGREEEPPEPWEIEGPAATLSFGDAADIDPALLVAICGPDGLGSDALGPQFSQGAAADGLRPGPLLAALTEQASADLSRLTDNQLIGALHAARRLENRAHYLQTRAIAEFARRRAEEFETAKARGGRVRCRAGEFPGVELASELIISRVEAGHWIDWATRLTTRLPRTLQGMSDGLINAERAAIIATYTGCLSPEDAARVDGILAPDAHEIRAETLARRAAALEMKLDPDAAKARKERTRRAAQRVEVRLERSGNASVAGRELDIADALASKANIHAVALRLRRAGLEGALDHLRAGVFNDLLQGRDPFDRLAPVPEAPTEEQPTEEVPPADRSTEAGPTPGADRPPADEHIADDCGPTDDPIPEGPSDGWDFDDDLAAGEYPADQYGNGSADRELARIGNWPDPVGVPGDDPWAPEPEATDDPGAPARAPMPAVINLLVHAGTLYGWDTTPSWANGWGLLNPTETKDIVRAASQHPQTRWCMTVVGRDNRAVAHGCSPGQHPWSPADSPGSEAPPGAAMPPDPARPDAPDRPGRPGTPDGPDRPDEPDARQAAQFADLLRRLNIALEPIAQGTCDHGHAEDRYTPSRKLQHLIRARSGTCTAPGCQAEAVHADLDHTVPYPDGATDECNLGPACRSHHQAKQAPGWKVEQPEPGLFRWTLPSGRTHTTRPTSY